MSEIGFDIPDYKKIRVIVDTDAACEADDPFAIVLALLSPKLIVKGVVAEHFNVAHSMEDSYNEILTIKQAMAVDSPAFMVRPDLCRKIPMYPKKYEMLLSIFFFCHFLPSYSILTYGHTSSYPPRVSYLLSAWWDPPKRIHNPSI